MHTAFCRFPDEKKIPECRAKWIQAIRRKDWTPTSGSDHFEKKCFVARTRRVIRAYLTVRTKTYAKKHTKIIAHGNMLSSRQEMTKLFCLGGHERETVVVLRKPFTMTSLLFCCSLPNFIYSLLLLLTQYN